jgi:hypothetical protein
MSSIPMYIYRCRRESRGADTGRVRKVSLKACRVRKVGSAVVVHSRTARSCG